MKKLILMITALMSMSIYALETGNFYGEMNLPEDSVSVLNKFLNHEIQRQLNKNSQKFETKSCTSVRKKVLKYFRGFIVHKIERHVDFKLDDRFITPGREINDSAYFDYSIYDKGKFDMTRLFRLSRGVLVNNILIGSDKFSHFISTGIRYFTIYENALEDGLSNEQATRKAIRFGIFTEKFILGKLGAKVFSFADLEANFQGFLLNKRFCDEDRPYIKKINGTWKLVSKIDLREYVNPYWSEVFNPSHFSNGRWKVVKKNITSKYCDSGRIGVLKERINNYGKKAEKSFSVKYIEELVERGDISDRRGQLLGLDCLF